LDLGCGVRLGGGRGDAGGGEPVVAGQGLEEVDGFLEVVDDFFSGLVVGIAVWVKGRDASAVLGLFVLLKGLVITFIVFLVRRYIVEERSSARGGNNS